MSDSSILEENLSPYGKLLAELVRGEVDFAVVGGLAVMFNGYGRSTLDSDIIVSDEPENIGRLLGVLRDWGEGWARELTPDDFQPEEGAVRLVEDYELDIFTRLRGRSLNDFRPNLKAMKWHGVMIPYLSAPDLIYCKESSVRDKDRLDVAALREIMRRESQS